MPWGGKSLEVDARAEGESFAVCEGLEIVIGSRLVAKHDARADAVAQFDVASGEVSMEVSKDGVGDREADLTGVVDIDVDVASGVDDDGGLGFVVGDQVGRLREAVEVVLLQDYWWALFSCAGPLGRSPPDSATVTRCSALWFPHALGTMISKPDITATIRSVALLRSHSGGTEVQLEPSHHHHNRTALNPLRPARRFHSVRQGQSSQIRRRRIDMVQSHPRYREPKVPPK